MQFGPLPQLKSLVDTCSAKRRLQTSHQIGIVQVQDAQDQRYSQRIASDMDQGRVALRSGHCMECMYIADQIYT